MINKFQYYTISEINWKPGGHKIQFKLKIKNLNK